ncbi:hypothetical protein [Streptomyces sp. NPDC001970]
MPGYGFSGKPTTTGWGPDRTARAWASPPGPSPGHSPLLARKGGGALVKMLLLASWAGQPLFPGYAASKAAQWSLTDAGYVDTDLSAWTAAPKISAADVAEQTVQALANDQIEALAKEEARQKSRPPCRSPSIPNPRT